VTEGLRDPLPSIVDPLPSIVPPGLDATLVLARHGESEWIVEGRFQGQGDSPLSALGRRQARLLARRLAHPARPPALPLPAGPPRAIVHSPLSRTTETARTVRAAMVPPSGHGTRVPRRPDPAFLEIGQGEWEGLAGSTITERWGDLLRGWREDPLTAWAPGGESLAVVDRRVRAGLGQLLADLALGRRPGTINRSQVLGYVEPASDEPWSILIAHDGVFKVTLLALLDLPLDRFWTFPFALCGITVVEFQGGRPRLRLHNSTEHLARLEAPPAAGADRGRSGAL
jgi:phosphoserine phosphatase